MSNAIRTVAKGDYLFREGDAAEDMFVIRSGKLAIVKSKGNSEILLAEKSGGEVLGEMGFFDNRPRSAGARAVTETQVISLPFLALHAQFKTFPEWLKVMVKTINSQLREANSRIKNLETAVAGEEEFFPAPMITRLAAIITLVAAKSGVPGDGGLDVPYQSLRDYCIQIFQQPTNKLDRMLEIFSEMGHATFEDVGEGMKRVVLKNPKLLGDFTEWYNRWLFSEPSKRVTIEEKEMNGLRTLNFYGARATPDRKGLVTVSLTAAQADSTADLGFAFGVNDADPFVEKGLAQEKRSGDNGELTMAFNQASVATILPYWEIIYTLRKAKR